MVWEERLQTGSTIIRRTFLIARRNVVCRRWIWWMNPCHELTSRGMTLYPLYQTVIVIILSCHWIELSYYSRLCIAFARARREMHLLHSILNMLQIRDFLNCNIDLSLLYENFVTRSLRFLYNNSNIYCYK